MDTYISSPRFDPLLEAQQSGLPWVAIVKPGSLSSVLSCTFAFPLTCGCVGGYALHEASGRHQGHTTVVCVFVLQHLGSRTQPSAALVWLIAGPRSSQKAACFSMAWRFLGVVIATPARRTDRLAHMHACGLRRAFWTCPSVYSSSDAKQQLRRFASLNPAQVGTLEAGRICRA